MRTPGPLRHQVIFELKAGTTGPSVEAFLADARRLLSAIPGVTGFRVLRQVSPKNEYPLGFSMDFATAEAFERYNDHPVHVAFVRERWDREVARFLEIDLQDRTDLRGVDVGAPALAGSTTAEGTGYTLRAGGADVWESRDEFHFAHREVEGDFDWKVRLASLDPCHPYTKAGLMVRESLADNAVHFYHLVFPDNRLRNNNSGGYEAQFRAQTGRNSLALYPVRGQALPPEFPVSFPNVWLRLERRGDRLKAYAGSDGRTWTLYTEFLLALPPTVLVGLAVTSHDAAQTARAEFRDLSAL